VKPSSSAFSAVTGLRSQDVPRSAGEAHCGAASRGEGGVRWPRLRFGIRYMIDDVSAAVAFYTTHLGFTLEPDVGRPSPPSGATV